MVAFKLLCFLLAFLTIASAVVNRNVTIFINLPSSAAPKSSTTTTTTTTTTTAKPIRLRSRLPEGYTRFPDINTAYKIHHDHVDWYTAKQLCNSEGARLAVPDTWRKVYHLERMQPALQWVWTGIHRRYFDYNNWETVDGGELSSNLPWSLLGGFIQLGNCVAVSGVVHGLGCWPCELQKMFACEIPNVA